MSAPLNEATESKAMLYRDLTRPPTRIEIQACWELCRLHNNIGFWVVWIPTGTVLFHLH